MNVEPLRGQDAVAEVPALTGNAMLRHLKSIAALPGDYWWHQHRFELVAQQLDVTARRILDFGCGTGDFVRMLATRLPQHAISGFDAEKDGIATAALPSDNISWIESPEALSDKTFDAVTLLDVLEHVEDDLALLCQLRGLLRVGGQLIVTVPAFRLLWSGWDVRLGHQRRYRRQQLFWLLQYAGFEVERASYFFSYLTLPALVRRFRDPALSTQTKSVEFISVPRWANYLLRCLGALERVVLKRLDICCGTSLLVRARAVEKVVHR